MKSKTSIWSNVSKTDPSFTKSNPHGHGGSTSINTTYAFKRATEQFGPIGIGWGYEIISDEIIEGAQKKFGAKDSEQIVTLKIHTLRIKFWYIHDDKRGEFEQFGHTDFVSVNKFGAHTESEPQKKSLSDAIKKSLSMLGFSADIYLGLYDDQSYVNEVALDIAAEKAEETIDRAEQKTAEFKEWLEDRAEIYANCPGIQTLNSAHKKSMRLIAERLSFNRYSQKQHDHGVRYLASKFEEKKGELE